MRHPAKLDRVVVSSARSSPARWRSLLARLLLAAAFFVGAPARAVAAASLAGVHWYSGDSSMLDLAVPAGERGFNVEVIFDTGWCDGNPSTDPGGVRAVAATAKAHGLVNIIRVDYRQMLAVPPGSAEYASWAADFIKCTQELSDLSSLFVVGNEPNIEGSISAVAYASAFNHLYSRKGEMPAGTQLLATFNSPFTPPGWMLDMSSRLGGVDGFAVHTGGVRANCRDPRLACSYGGWSFDGAFRYYRDVIANIHSSWWSRAVYITEFNTYTGDPGSEPDVNYPAEWINLAFEEIRSYNATRGTRPAVKALCWFVDRPQSWPRFALRNISAARADMAEEFKNPANRGAGGGTCANDPLAVPSDRWKLEIWNNRGFAGGTVEQRYEAAGGGGFGFQWGSGRPSNCVGTDNFAVRFTRRAYFSTSGSYTFTARTDDGVRLWVDGTQIIDDWRDMPPTDHTGQITLAAGWHELRMDYYENAGGAVAVLGWTGGSGSPPSNVARTAVGWTASSSYSAAFRGDKAYDGIVSAASKWTSNGTTADSWLALDLGRSYDVTQFVVKHAGSAGELTSYNAQAFRLESGTSLSGPWTTQTTVANTAQANTSSVTLAAPITTRYVRLYITDAGIDNYARIPELEVYGTPSAPPPGPGSLVNGDFESSTPGSAVGTGWTSFSSAGYAAGFNVVSDQVHGGSFAQRVRSPQPSSNDRYAGVYQVVGTVPGQQYTVRAWNRTLFSGGNAWDYVARLGIDLAGGTNFEAASVSRSEFDSAKNVWLVLERSVTATSGSMTIFLEAWRKWPAGGDSYAWFDDVQVSTGVPPVNHPPTAVASANPTTGPAPLAVAFSGTGSTDPDGDPLTCAWSFGDGTSGSGATVSHTYAAAGTYTATLTVNDGRGGTHSAEVAVVVDPPSGNRPPTAVISASPESGTVPFTVTLDGQGSSDPDGDPLSYTWQFADGVQGTGPTLQRHFPLGDWRRGEGLEEYAGGYLVTLTVTDDEGATGSASLRIKAIPPQGCPESLDFDAIRTQLAAQGQDLAFSKIGFHTGGGGTITGLGVWERCLDLNGVPFTVKQVPSDVNASAAKAAMLRKRSGVPHTAIFRRCCVENGVNYELPACAIASASTGWSLCTMENAQQEAQAHWQRHLQAFPPDLEANKHLIWVETINEPWKGSSTRNNAEWLAKFSYYTALEALAAGYNYAAFGWSTGEPQYGPRPADEPLSPEFQWDGPEMQNFLRLAAQYPDRIALSLHEYNLDQPTLRDTYPNSAGRFTKVFERCDANGIPRPTVLITEFGWPGVPSVPEMMSAGNVPWAAGMYAQHPQVKGVALWDDGGVVDAIAAFTTYSLQNYFAIPKPNASLIPRRELTGLLYVEPTDRK